VLIFLNYLKNASLVKAINNLETPIKEKHVRNLILGTFHEKNALTYWFNALRLPLYGNQVVCWKFCYTTHKILRDGYPTSVHDSFRYVATLEDLAKSWMHLKQGYYLMIFHYCSYLVNKLKFHKKNEFLPTNLMIEDKSLIDGVGNDINNYFQLCCDFFDYLDEILALQNAIFLTMDRDRSNSMTESGQLKLAPIIILVQESNQLYDFCVKFLFKLHDNLPGDTLEGHRDRFLKIFHELSKFYQCCRNLQYFKNLMTIPELPSQPPNFRVKSDFNSYQKPVMTVIEEDNASVVEEDVLLDFNNDTLNNSSSSNSVNENSLQNQQYIQQLLMEIERLRAELDRLHNESQFEIRNLRERIKFLNDELMKAKTEMEQEKIVGFFEIRACLFCESIEELMFIFFKKTSNLEETVKIMNENEKSKADLDNLESK
jgi:huntingtin interacting protein 1